MKAYKSSKTVHAEQMSQTEWLEIRSKFQKYSSSHLMGPDNPGYHVVYDMGTEDEYHSWSPQAQFENGYTALE